jgi:hypothetical protein
LNGIGIKSQSFRRLAEPYIWNFIIENNDKDDIVENDKEDGDGVAAVAAAAAAAASTTTAAASTTTALLHPPVPANKKRKLENGVSNEYVSSNYSSYPNLSSALGQEDGFDPTDSSVRKKMRALLAELIDLLSDDYELNIIDSANNSVSYVRVPKTSSDRSFQNSKEWLDVAIKVAGTKHGGTYQSAYRIANHLLRFYRDSVLAACETQRLPTSKPMTATQFSAMMHASGVSGTGQQEIKKHLKDHLGVGFCPTRRCVSMLSEGHGDVSYGCINFTYEGKQQQEFIEWSEKRIDDEIARYLQRHLQSKSAKPADVVRVQAVVGGDHGDTAFQFGASVSAELSDGQIIDFEVSVCELICRKDTGKLIELTILPTLTDGLIVVATSPLHIYEDADGKIICKFGETCPTTEDGVTTIPHVDLYITGDLAFQAMALGKESMSGHWCMQCTMQMQCTLTEAQLNEIKMWTMEELCRLGDEAEQRRKGETMFGVKKKPWWPFIPITHYMIPLLHCMIGVGNQLLDMLRDIINEHLENMTHTEERVRASIPILKNIITETAAARDIWDASNEGKLCKTLKRKVLEAAKASAQQDSTHAMDERIKFKELEDHRNREFVLKLEKARNTLRDQQNKLKTMRTSKVRAQDSIETKMFSVLKEIGVELSSYHGGSLNGKDIRKVMTNASYVFDSLAIIFKGGKRPNCVLSDANIDALCLQFREVFVLWDGAFSLARTINPTEMDIKTYRMFVNAAAKGSKDLRCTVTPKVHLMLEHVEWQMRNIRGGLGDKMEDWVERLHQDGKRDRRLYRTVQNPLIRSIAREKAHSRNMHPDVIAQTNKVNEGNKRNLTELKTDLAGTLRKRQRDVGRYEAMKYFMQDDVKRLSWSAPLFNDGKSR